MYNEKNDIKIAGVIGDPIRHTRSPLIHNYWIKKNNINCFYIPLNVKSNELEKKLHYIRGLNFSGINVTVPHKEKIIKFADEIMESAKIVGAANTIYFNDGKIIADNTDSYGFHQSLIKNFPKFNFKKERILIFGAGGAARAVVSVFIKENIQEIRLINRNKDKALKIRDDLSSKIQIYDWSEYQEALKGVSTVVNTTSLGNLGSDTFTLSLKGIKENGIAIDLVYNPLKTSFIKQAQKEKLKTVNGLDMLIYQAKKGFETWFKKKPTYTYELKQIIEKSLKS